MKITAREIMERSAAPMPGQRPAQPQGRPAPMGMEPAAPEEPGMPGEDPTGGATDPNAAAQADAGAGDLQALSQQLLNEYFDDRKINEVSDQLQKLIPLIGPEHAEKFVKVQTDWIKSTMILKANIISLVVLATPQKMMQNQMDQMMKNLQQQAGGMGGGMGQQPLKVPVT